MAHLGEPVTGPPPPRAWADKDPVAADRSDSMQSVG